MKIAKLANGLETSPQNKQWIQHADCRRKLPNFSAHSISLILTDPPYFIDGMDDKWNHVRLRARCKNGVIGGLPVGMKFSPQQGRNLYNFLHPAATEWLRIIKPGGFALCFSQSRLAHRTATAIEDAGFEIRDILAWRYEGQAKAFSQDHFIRRRPISEEAKQKMIRDLGGRKTPQLKPQMELIILAQAPRIGTFVDNWLQYRAGLINSQNPLIEPARFPGTVIPAPKPRERYGHMTAKPVNLLRHLIRIFCADGEHEIILDPFAGSGSTGVAARMEGRGFSGFEIDKTMAKIANQRVTDVL